jgi:hypothetical protein
MGIKVGTKCYEFLEKKYLKSDQQNKRASDADNLEQLFKRKVGKYKEKKTSGASSHYSSSSNSMVNQSSTPNPINPSIGSFRETLKENVYPKPLPKIKKPK